MIVLRQLSIGLATFVDGCFFREAIFYSTRREQDNATSKGVSPFQSRSVSPISFFMQKSLDMYKI